MVSRRHHGARPQGICAHGPADAILARSCTGIGEGFAYAARIVGQQWGAPLYFGVMRRAKDQMMQEDEQGWTFTHKTVCARCMNEPYLTAFIRNSTTA